MEEWEAWRTLLAVARAGTLADAAAGLGIDATTAGRRIRRLEARVGRRLLERRGGRLAPTPACALLLPRLEDAEAALAEAGAAMGEGAPAARPVRVTAVPVLCDHLLAPAVPRLTRVRRVALELAADERNLSLTRREADLALRLGPPAGSTRGARPVGALPYAVYAPAGLDPEAVPWAALDAAQSHLPEVRFVERAAGRAGIRHRASRLETLRALVAAGEARSLLPVILGDRDPGIRRVGERGVVARPLWLIAHPEDEATPAIAAVARWIAEAAGAL
jgi:DNA-binding transcriptional LysR family regulator